MEKMVNIKFNQLELLAKTVRKHVLEMLTRTKSSHIGSCYSIVEILIFLYANKIVDHNKNKFLLSKGHAAAVMYAVLAECGYFDVADLDTYGMDGSALMSHVNSDVPGIEFSTGSLGHALPVSIGFAMSQNKKTESTYVLLSDGELNEGSNWEAILLAAHLELSNLIILIDSNKLQGLDKSDEVINMSPLKEKFISFGCNVIDVKDGHSFDQIEQAIIEAENMRKENKPIVIVLNTIKGKGVSFMENKLEWHYKSPNDEEYQMAMTELK